MIDENPKKERYSWEFYHTLVLELAKQIKTTPNIIIGIGKGGLIPGVILAEKFECTLLNYGLRSYNGFTNTKVSEYQKITEFESLKQANILIVDDIADTGNTFKHVVDVFSKISCNSLNTACVFYKPQSSFKPNCIAREMPNDIWIVQPWEIEL
jgi:hypoxanthine phosphoribosyltransferase